MELRTSGIGDAVVGPGAALTSKRAMVRRVPIAGGDDELSLLGEVIDQLDHGVAVGHRERSSRTEVVLHIDDHERLHAREYSRTMGPSSSSREAVREALRKVLLSTEDAVGLEVRGGTDAAVLVALYLDQNELVAVLTQRRTDLRRHAGEISFPGGRHDEADIDLSATALREAHEEIGLAPEAVELLGALQPTPTIATGYAVYPFVGLIDRGQTWQLSPLEVAEVLELPLSELRAGYGRRRLLRRGIPIRTDTYVVDGKLIWGATARILADLFDRISAF